jgi:putative DNA methylase
MTLMKLIESDQFPIEFLSLVAERESWRKEIHRPIYHVHKWWAKRLGSVFRGILLGSVLPDDADLAEEFYNNHEFGSVVVWDPFMGSGTTIGEANKLGMIALGRDINPVAKESVRVALGPISMEALTGAFRELEQSVGVELRQLCATVDSRGEAAEVLYWFWVMVANCPQCSANVELFSSRVIARNAYPNRKPEVQVVCPHCAGVFESDGGRSEDQCPHCHSLVAIHAGPASGARAACPKCSHSFSIIEALRDNRPPYRLVAKLVLRSDGTKEYLAATAEDVSKYEVAESELVSLERQKAIRLPLLELSAGYNTKQAMRYGFRAWRDFFNARQLLALGKLSAAIDRLEHSDARDALRTLFSGVLEFNNMFATYKGEGTGAIRHMFSHHILKPERTPIEANVWGTPKSSGSFSTLFRSRLLRAFAYRSEPKEVSVPPYGGRADKPASMRPILSGWTAEPKDLQPRSVSLSCGDSAKSGLSAGSVDLVVTDPPFFDNVHYSELADFFHAWRSTTSTRHAGEVQDTDAAQFSAKLTDVLSECLRTLTPSGLLVFTYHHSREDGWQAVGAAILGAGFVVANAHPLKAEMSVATPKSQAKEPIQIDVALVCRSRGSALPPPSKDEAIERGSAKIARLRDAGFQLSRNDLRAALYGQLLCSVRTTAELPDLESHVERAMTTLGSAALAGAVVE